MNVLVVSPHPDDLEYGCGGTLVKLARRGRRIHLLYMTRGEMGGRPEVREREADKAAKVLKAEVHWGGFRDTGIPLSKETIQAIELIIAKVQPSLIFTPYHNDTHQDHRNTSQATFTASRHHQNVVFYEVPTSVDFVPTVFVDIGPVLQKKLALLRAHRSQVYQTKVPGLSILENARSTAIFRGMQFRVKYAEGFLPARLGLDLLMEKR